MGTFRAAKLHNMKPGLI